MEEHKQRLDKEYETLSATFCKEIDKLRAKHQQEKEKKVSKTACYNRILQVNESS